MRHAARRSLTLTLFGVIPAALVVVCLIGVVGSGPHRSDFWTFWTAGRDVLHGRSPYPALSSLPEHAYRSFAPFVYPPVTAFTMAPIAVLPFGLAKVAYFLLSISAVVLALRLLGVRDWRCHGAALACAPVYAAAGLGAVGPFLLLGVAAAWRYRERAVACGLLVAYVITAKLFLWPLWFWLVRTQRWRAAAVSAGVGVAAVVVSWAAIGFAGLRDYPRLLSRLTELTGVHSYSVYSFERALGVGSVAAQRSLYALAFLLLALIAVFLSGDRRVLIAVLGVSLLATPILWPHYLVLIFVPIALASAGFSWLWLAPLAVWIDAAAWSGNPAWMAGLLGFVCVITAVALARTAPRTQARDLLVAAFDPS
jgi:alpha-1,2-mannosyltransferase